ncbi:MAG: hypothetical protein Q7U39_01705 [Nitrospira sp.]|nr:hypothetical protein [Nitrospira sp.]
MYTAYGDESADETKQRVFALSGLFGSKPDWDALREKWRARTGGKSFHATDCDTDQGDYKGIEHAQNKKLYADLTRLIADSNLIGYVAVMDLQAYREIVAPALHEEPYYYAFYSVVITIAKKASLSIPRGRIKFFFDRNQQIEYNAGALYDRIINRSLPSRELMDDEISFVTREEIGVQAADLVAREGMKLLDNELGPVSRPTRLSAQVLMATHRINFRFYRRAWFISLVEGSRLSETGYSWAEYQKWLDEHGLTHTVPNKLRYEATRQDLQGKVRKLFDEFREDTSN